VLFSSRVRIRVRIRFSVWSVGGCAHVFIQLSVIIVTEPAIAANTPEYFDTATFGVISFRLQQLMASVTKSRPL